MVTANKILPFRHNDLSSASLFDEVHDESFFDDALELFLGTNSGHLGKYIYGFSGNQKLDATATETDIWNEIVVHSDVHYIPRADKNLLRKALPYFSKHIPKGISYVDFGVGSDETLKRLTLPAVKILGSKKYYALDCCEKYLGVARRLETYFGECKINTIHTDFFVPPNDPIENNPAFGVMTGCTIGNMYGALRDQNVTLNLSRTLKNLLRFMPQGWLAISVDTNHDETALFNNYMTSLHHDLFLSILFRIKALLPEDGFNPHLFEYAPEWHPELHLFAHVARATKTQQFMLGDKLLNIKQGQKFHLLNSYKFGPDIFESCCVQANLSVIKRWDHETPVKLYLLKTDS